MKQIAILALLFLASIVSFPATAQTEELSQVKISATIRTYVLNAPRPNAELVGILQPDAVLSAFGRDEEGNWLRIMEGWVLADVFNTEGEIGALPDTTHSFLGATIAHTFLHDGPSERWFNSLASIGDGTQILIIGRNEDSTWLQILGGWVDAADVTTDGDVSLLPVTLSGVIITARTRTFILKEPDLSAEFVDVFESGDEALATGRSGNWLQLAQGWVSNEAVQVRGDVSGLPFAGGGIPFTAKLNREIRSAPTYVAQGRIVQILKKGSNSMAIGRNEAGNWLLVQSGWTYVGRNPRSYIESDGDLMSLPVFDETATSVNSLASNQASAPTATTSSATNPDAQNLRSLIIRHTDDIRILDIKTAASATTIEYDLKPWPIVPNESIASEVAFKIICAIRNGQPVPNTLKFIGHTHFKSEVGRKFTGPSVEMHISAPNANRIVCRGNDPSDINWRTLASRYKSYPIPRGASIDYD